MWAKEHNPIRKGNRTSSKRIIINLSKLMHLIFDSAIRVWISELFYLTVSYKINKNYTFRIITTLILSLF